jgi:hypothetical protein
MHHPLPLLLLGLNNGLHCPLLINGGTHQFIVGPVGGLNQAVLQLDGKPFTKEVDFFLIRINMIWAILSQVVEMPGVVEYGMIPLLEIQKFLQLVVEQTHRQVVSAEGSVELA